MPLRSFRNSLRSSAQALAAFAIAVPALHAQTPVLHPHVPALVASGEAQPLAATDTTKRLRLVLSLPLRNEADLDARVADIYNPHSPNYRHYLTPAEFDAAYGPTQADYDTLVSWAQAKGLTVTGTVANRRLIDVEAPVEAVNRAFHVQLHDYLDPKLGRVFHSADHAVATDLPIPLLSVSGLDNAYAKHPHYKRGNAFTANGMLQSDNAIAHISGSGPGNTYLPSDMRAAYYGSGPLTGSGQTVAIFSYDGYIASDLTLFYSKTGMANTVPVKNVLVNGYSGACFGFNANGSENANTCDDGEQILDIVNVAGMAPGLTQILFYEGDSSTDVLNKMASDNTAKVISSSWGGGDFGTASDPAFKQFQAQGQTYLNATGDSGQFNSSTYDPPSLDPYIVQVGGTDLTTTGAGGTWSAETGWLDSGGGFYASAGYSIPSFQSQPGVITSTNKGSTTYRNAPDIAAEANFDNTTVDNGTFESGYGGTSYATPRWAGYIALANQQAVANGNGTVGFINPTVYTTGLGSAASANFHDVTSGNNKPSAGSGAGFNAVAGYDLVTGWGSPNGPTLINTLAGTKSTATADYTLSASPASLSIATGKTGSSTVTVSGSNGFSGSVALSVSGLPSGVTASFSPASTTSTSTLTFTVASTATAGTSTITVKGTSGSLSHTTTVSLTVTSSTGAATQIVGNPGFENGTTATPWTLSSGTLCSTSTSGCSAEAPHAGSWFVWLDGYGKTHTDTASQTVAIPTGKSTASLSFYLHIDTAETTKTKAYDTLKVQLLNSSGTVLTTLATFSNLNAAGGYAVHTYNLAGYIGQTVTLKFTGAEDSSAQTSFVLDDVTLTVQ